MARFTYENIEDAKGQTHQGEAFYKRRGQIYSRSRKYPPKNYRKNPSRRTFQKTQKRAIVTALMREISEKWASLSISQKNAWISYAAAAGTYKTGYKAFAALNMRLQRCGSSCFAWVMNITCPPISYNLPTGICTSYIKKTASFCIMWATPLCTSLFIQAFEWLPPGRWRVRNQPWKYSAWAISSDGQLAVPVTFLEAGRFAQLTIRTINLRGEISSFPTYQEDEKTYMQAGIYGYSYYAYSTYGP